MWSRNGGEVRTRAWGQKTETAMKSMVDQRLSGVGGAEFRRHMECLRAPDGRFFTMGARNKRRLKTWEAEDAAGWSGGAAIVVVQETAEPLATFDPAGGLANVGAGLQDGVVERLVISLAMIMDQPLIDRVTHRLLAEEDQPVETLSAKGSEKAFDLGIGQHLQMHPFRALGRESFA